MTAREILDHIEAENVRLVLLENDKIDVSGDKVKVGKLLPFIRDHKNEIVNYLRGDGPEWITPAMYMSPATRGRDTRQRPSPVALSWLQDHRKALKAAGWTMRELYRRNGSRGICWCSLWDKPFFKAYLHDNGIIEMECVIADRDVIQTTRSDSFWRKSKHQNNEVT